jgi:aspartokinase-like uncharacterized kinase
VATDLARRRPSAPISAGPASATRPRWVVKLGGSLAQSQLLKTWLALLAAAGGAVVIVPGGGPFADQVRDAQKCCGFDDATAHHMALLAMEQYGRLLAGLHPGLRPAASLAEIARTRRAGLVPVWMPTRMVLGRPEIPESWDITSDSLAAWLAGALGSGRLLLVKSIAVPGDTVTATQLARSGVVDPAFPRFLARSGSAAWCIDASRHTEMAAALRHDGAAGTRITVTAGTPATHARRPRRAIIDHDAGRAG